MRRPGRPRIALQLFKETFYLDSEQKARLELRRAQGYSKSAAGRLMLNEQPPVREARQLLLWQEAEQLSLELPELDGDAGDVFTAAAAAHAEELVRLADALAALVATRAPANDQTAAPREEEALWAAVEARAAEERAEERDALAAEGTEPPELGAEEHQERGEVRRGWRLREAEPPPSEDWIVALTARVLVLARGANGPKSPAASPPGSSAPSWVPEPYRAEYERLRKIFPHADPEALWKRVRKTLVVERGQQRKPQRE